MSTKAIANVKNHLAKANNIALADALEIAITGKAPGVDVPVGHERALSGILYHIIREARSRVGEAATTAAEAARKAFNEKHGIHDEMTEDEMVEVFDSIPDEEFAKNHGEWFYLVAELRK